MSIGPFESEFYFDRLNLVSFARNLYFFTAETLVYSFSLKNTNMKLSTKVFYSKPISRKSLMF